MTGELRTPENVQICIAANRWTPVRPAAALSSRAEAVPGWLASARAVPRRSSRPHPHCARASGVGPAPASRARRVAPFAVCWSPGVRPVLAPGTVRSLPRSLAGPQPLDRPKRPAPAGRSAAFPLTMNSVLLPTSFGHSALAGLPCRLLTSAVRSGRIPPPPARVQDGREISRGKLDRLQRTTTAGLTTSALDGSGLCLHMPTRPTPYASDPLLVHRLAAPLHKAFSTPPHSDAPALHRDFTTIRLSKVVMPSSE